MEGQFILKITNVDTQGYALSQDDIKNIAGTPLYLQMMKHRVVIEVEGELDTLIINEIDHVGYFYIESVYKNCYRFWFEKEPMFTDFVNVLALHKMKQDV